MKAFTIRALTVATCVVVSSLVHAGPFTEPFAGANDFSLIVAGNAHLGSGVHVHGGGYVGGNLTVTGSNGGFGQALPAGSMGLLVGGNVLSGNGNPQQIALFNKDRFIGGTTTNINWQNPAASLAANPLAQNAADIAAALSNKSAELAGLAAVGASVNAADFNNIVITLTAGITNVLNLNSGNASFLGNSNSNINFVNFSEGTRLIVNYDLGGSAFTFSAKNQGMPSSAFNDAIWNFVGDKNLTIANSVSTFKGTLLAANSFVDWDANDIDGQLIAKSLDWAQTSQSHYYVPWSTFEPETPVETPEPESLLLMLGALASLGLAKRFTRNRK